MGQKYNIPEFLAMCNFIFDLAGEKNLAAPDCLIWFMLCPQYRNLEFGESYDFGNFHAFYRDSGIVRGRNGRFTYTVMSGKSNFFIPGYYIFVPFSGIPYSNPSGRPANPCQNVWNSP